jgi:anti-sigma factor RsiW
MDAFLARLRFAIDHRWAPGRMSAFLDHDLTPHQRTRMERHVGECRRCRSLLSGLQLVVAALHRLPAPSDGDATRIVASVRVHLSEPDGRSPEPF